MFFERQEKPVMVLVFAERNGRPETTTCFRLRGNSAEIRNAAVHHSGHKQLIKITATGSELLGETHDPPSSQEAVFLCEGENRQQVGRDGSQIVSFSALRIRVGCSGFTIDNPEPVPCSVRVERGDQSVVTHHRDGICHLTDLAGVTRIVIGRER